MSSSLCELGVGVVFLNVFSLLLFQFRLIIEIRIVGIVVGINIIIGLVVLINFPVRRIRLLLLLVRIVVVAIVIIPSLIIIGPTTANNGFTHTPNPIILLMFGIGIEQILRFGRTNFERVSFLALEIGGFDGSAVRQIHHAVGSRVFVLGEKEFAALENKVPTAPFLVDYSKEKAT